MHVLLDLFPVLLAFLVFVAGAGILALVFPSFVVEDDIPALVFPLFVAEVGILALMVVLANPFVPSAAFLVETLVAVPLEENRC